MGTAMGIAVLWPIYNHHDLNWMNGHLVETISGALATHPEHTKLWGAITGFLGIFSFWNLCKNEFIEASDGKSWKTETKKSIRYGLTAVGLLSFATAVVGELGILWFPIGGDQSSIHKLFVPVFFIPTAIGMTIYSVISWRKNGRSNWRTIFFGLLAFLAVAFAATNGFVKDGKNQIKMTQQDCLATHPNNYGQCTAERNTFKPDSVWGNCRPEIPSYGAPRKLSKRCEVALDDLSTFEKAKTTCEAATNEKGEKCLLYDTDTKLTGWYTNIGECTSPDKELKKATDDQCHEASARNPKIERFEGDTLGKIDNDAFKASCAATTDTAGNQCDYTPSSVIETFWRAWSIMEITAFGAAYFFFGILHGM